MLQEGKQDTSILSSQISKPIVYGGFVSVVHPHTPWGRIRCRTQTSASLQRLLPRIFFFFESNLFLYFWLHWVFVASCRLSLVTASGGCSLVAVLRLLMVVASLVEEHGL